MNPLEGALVQLVGELSRLGVPWALIGGLAVSLRTEPRTTRDIDVAVALDSLRAEDRLVRELTALGYRQLDEGTFWQREVDRLATLRLHSPVADEGIGIVVDLMFASSGIEPEVVAHAEPMQILPGLSVPVARTGHLVALKVLADRALDRADLERLVRVAVDADISLAREALDLIARRGYDRGRDLIDAFERVMRQGS